MIKRIVDRLKYWGQLLFLPVYGLSFLFPRDKNIWLFGSTFGRRFADNPRYLFIYVSQNKENIRLKDNSVKNIRPIWISHNKDIVDFLCKEGYEAYYYHSFKGIWYALRAKVYLFDNYSKDINFWQSAGALKINMWHGIPLKKIQHDNVFDKFRNPRNLKDKICNFPRNISDEKPSHYVLTTSKNFKNIFSSAFQTNNVLISGYPRCDAILSGSIENILMDKEKDVYNRLKNFKGKKVLYMPTFRESEKKFFDIFDEKLFNIFLRENEILFSIKLHPKSHLRKRFQDINESNINIIDADVDPYFFLNETDMLITDYSSIYFDYLLLNKPIIFFNYDMHEYLSDSRELYFEYEKFTPGAKVKTMEELQNAIVECLEGHDSYVKEREKIKRYVFDYCDGNASKRIIEDIKNIL